ncbi:RecX family transcriptional regulator [Sphingomonas sp. FARSPH]|nr:RecX family transcriptional regulator [Sphingomonas sp. FARSPH]
MERMALRYVERFATTQGKLAAYLVRKVRERGWDAEGVDPAALAAEIAARMAELGYVDDRLFAESKAAALGRRGLGARRVAEALRAAHVPSADAEAMAPDIAARAGATALRFAQRRRLGPFGPEPLDRAGREKQIAAMLRAGHPLELSRRIVQARSADDILQELEGSD